MTPEEKRVLIGAIRALPAQERLIVRLVMNGKSHREIAALLGYRSHRSVGWWLRKAYRHLERKIPTVRLWLYG